MSLSFQPGAEAGKNQDANLGLGFETQASHNQPAAAKAPLPVREFTYTEVAKPPSESKAILGPAVRLFATFITLGFSEDIHKVVKRTLVATLSKVITSDLDTKDARENFAKAFKHSDHYKKAEKLSVSVGDKATLDGMLIKPEPSGESKKYVIWLNGLEGCYERKLDEAVQYADEVQANILVFNYRGCGDSTSNGPVQPKDLVTDTLAMIAFLKDRGVDPEDIVVHGYSFGGGIGAAAAQRADLRHINDRSFSTFSKATKEVVAAMVKEKVGKTAANAIGSLVASLVKTYNLDLNTGKVYRTGMKDTLILHHPKDTRVNKSSLKNFLFKHQIEKTPLRHTHSYIDLSENSDQPNDVHQEFFMNFENTKVKVAEFIHNGKPFAEIQPRIYISTVADDLTSDDAKNAGLYDDFGGMLNMDDSHSHNPNPEDVGLGLMNFNPRKTKQKPIPDATNSGSTVEMNDETKGTEPKYETTEKTMEEIKNLEDFLDGYDI